MQRSLYHRGAANGLALGKAHFPDEWVHDEMTSGWPSETGVVDSLEVLRQRAEAAPFADRLRRIDDMLPFLPTPKEDLEAEERDFDVERPIEASREGKLTTFKTNMWVPEHRRESKEASSSKATMGATSSKAGE